jgi:FkbM family methyltransferase
VKFEEEIELRKEQIVVERIKNSQNPIVLYGAANCAESLCQTIELFGRSPSAVFVDDPFYTDGATFHGVGIQRFVDVARSFEHFDVAVAIGTKSPNLASIEKHGQVGTVFPNVGYARGSAMDEKFIRSHWEDFRLIFDLLADNISKKSLVAFLENKMYGNLQAFASLREGRQYFGLDFMPLSDAEIMVDCGAFTGDSLRWFVKAVHVRYSKIYAWEPDPKNIVKLKNCIQTDGLNNVIVVPCCAYNKKANLCFDSLGTATSFVTDNGGMIVACDTIDDICGDATLIKMDVEGSEMEALSGASATI